MLPFLSKDNMKLCIKLDAIMLEENRRNKTK